MRNLDPVEIRVLGCLVEKQRTTPDAYPLSLNALRLACNQSTNRDPVMELDEAAVRDAAQRLGRKGLARLASRAGSRTTKYRHLLEDELGLASGELELLAVLMLRGAQTPGELKQRTERMHRFETRSVVVEALERLGERGLARRLEREPGQKEERYAQLLSEAGATEDELVASSAPREDSRTRVEAGADPTPREEGSPTADVADRADQVAVIGDGTAEPGSDAHDAALEVGRLLAEQGAVLVCGGLGGVMEAACRGAAQAGGRAIGIIPGDDPAQANPHCTQVVATGSGWARNLAVVASGEAVIAIGGRWGTLSEIGHARKLGRTVIALESWSVEAPAPLADRTGIELASSPSHAVELAIDAARRRRT